MKRFLKKYTVTLTVLSPVFIGSGRELSKKEYIFLDGFKRIGVIDINRFYTFVQKKGKLRQLEDFFLNDGRSDLRYFLKNNGFRDSDIESCLKYVLDCGDTSLERGTRASVMEFVRDPYGLPYVPGSSLKGVLRTILLSENIRTGSGYDRIRQEIGLQLDRGKGRGILKKESSALEAEAFNTLNREENRKIDAKNDEMAGLVIGDSRPMKVSDLILCQRVERKTDGSEKRLNVLRECIKPGTEISFDISVDESLLRISPADIMEAIADFSAMYNDVFVKKYRGMDSCGPDEVFLGGGTGFVSKTVVYPLFGDKDGVRKTVSIFEKTNVPRNHRHDRDIAEGVSPHIIKCTRYGGKLYQMGLCRIGIKEA